MTIKRIPWLVLAVGLLIAMTGITPVLAADDYHAQSFSVWVAIQPDGALLVTETVTFRFEDGPFTFVFRHLDRAGTDDIQVLEASMDGVVFQPGAKAGQVEITAGDPIEVTWHFAPTSASAHEFSLTYRVLGALQHDLAADTLDWNAIPAEHEYSIVRGLVRVTYPDELVLLAAPVLDLPVSELETGPGQIDFSTPELEVDQGVSVTIRFPYGSLVSQSPAWQIRQEQKALETARALPYGIGAAVLSTVLALFGVFSLGKRFRRAEAAPPVQSQQVTRPPSAAAPALAARLVGDSAVYLGTLFDLARRGALRIEEGPKSLGSRTFEVARQPVEVEFKPHESAFMAAFFKKEGRDRVGLTEISGMAYAAAYFQAIDAELVSAGWRDAARVHTRNRFLALSGFGLLGGLVSLLVGLFFGAFSLFSAIEIIILGAILIGAGIGVSLAALVGLIVAATISSLSEEGMRQASAWRSFIRYLRDVVRGSELSPTPDLFERYLPYAAAFGIATEWARYFQKMTTSAADVPVPAWFASLHTSLDDGSFAAILAAVGTAESAASSSSSGSDGGGASGGGSSGAG